MNNSLIKRVIQRAQVEPDRLAMVFIADDGVEEHMTTGQLHAEVAAAAGALHAEGVRAGDQVLISLPHSRALVALLWGAMYLGAIPSILPYERNSGALLNQIDRVVQQAQPRIVVTTAALAASLGAACPPGQTKFLEVGETLLAHHDPRAAAQWQPASGEQIMYIQYTSGTTGARKGVMLAHDAIACCLQSFVQGLAIRPDADVVVTWLPLYHDYGLFAGLMMPIAFGIPVVIMSPFHCIRRPESFLHAVHRHGGTLSWITNTGYHHLALKSQERRLDGLDLSSLRVLCCGGEPIRHESQQLFLNRFAPYGFCEAALVNGYGMAESTMGLTWTPPGARAPVDWVDAAQLQINRRAVPVAAHAVGAISVMSCGVKQQNMTVQIADEAGQILPERHVGNVLAGGCSIFSGYQNEPALTAQVLKDGWLHTGDLGYLADGHLYICGRKKDVIIVGGRNIHPEDVEAIAEKVTGVVPGRIVAFSIPDAALGTEQIVLLCGVQPSTNDAERLQIELAVRRRVKHESGLPLNVVKIVDKQWIIKTHNGKLPRSANRAKYLVEF